MFLSKKALSLDLVYITLGGRNHQSDPEAWDCRIDHLRLYGVRFTHKSKKSLGEDDGKSGEDREKAEARKT